VDETQLTPESLAIAREVLERNPEFARHADGDQLLQNLASQYLLFGDRTFRAALSLRSRAESTSQYLLFGDRTFREYYGLALPVPPMDPVEVRAMEAEMAELRRQHDPDRPVDERMIEELYRLLEEWLEAYQRLLAYLENQIDSILAGRQADWEGRPQGGLVFRVSRSPGCESREVETVIRFAEEVRSAHRLGRMEEGDAIWNTAVQFVLNMPDRIERNWVFPRALATGNAEWHRSLHAYRDRLSLQRADRIRGLLREERA